jgi:hypothetical protein
VIRVRRSSESSSSCLRERRTGISSHFRLVDPGPTGSPGLVRRETRAMVRTAVEGAFAGRPGSAAEKAVRAQAKRERAELVVKGRDGKIQRRDSLRQ